VLDLLCLFDIPNRWSFSSLQSDFIHIMNYVYYIQLSSD